MPPEAIGIILEQIKHLTEKAEAHHEDNKRGHEEIKAGVNEKLERIENTIQQKSGDIEDCKKQQQFWKGAISVLSIIVGAILVTSVGMLMKG